MAAGIPRLFGGTGVLPGDGSTDGLADQPFDIASPDAVDSPSDAPEDGAAADAIAVDNASSDFAADPSKPSGKQTAFKATPSAAEVAGENLIASPDDDAPAADEPAAAAAEFTPEVLEQAKKYGFDEESAKRFGSPENLQWAMAERDRVAAEWGQKQIAAAQAQQQPPQQPAAPQQIQQSPAAPQPATQPTTAQQQAVQKILAGHQVNRAKLIEEGFDDGTIKVLEGITGHYNSQLETVGQYIETMTQLILAQHQGANQNTGQSQADEEARLERDVDAFFEGLGPNWEPVFGKGPAVALKGKPELDSRIKVFNAFNGLKLADAQSNQRTPEPELLQRALSATHYQKKQELDRQALAEKTAKRRGQSVARAGTQRSQPLSGEEKAIARAQAFSRKHRLDGAIA